MFHDRDIQKCRQEDDDINMNEMLHSLNSKKI